MTPREQAIRQRLAKRSYGWPLAPAEVTEDIAHLVALLDQLRAEANDVRVVGDVPVSNTPCTSKDRIGVDAASGENPDPSPDQAPQCDCGDRMTAHTVYRCLGCDKEVWGDQLRAEGQPPQAGDVLGVTVAGGWQTTARAADADVATLRQQLETAGAIRDSAVKLQDELLEENRAIRQQLAQAQQELQLLAERVQDIPDIQARAEAAEATVASLRQLVTKWYEAADADLEAGNKQYGHALDQCADELDAALAALPTPSTKP